MATEAEATREARAKCVAATGEQNASLALKEAADTINKSPIALQLRYLQTLTHIAAEKNSTIVFPVSKVNFHNEECLKITPSSPILPSGSVRTITLNLAVVAS